MLKSIDIYNVNFGDCFILENNPDNQYPDKMLVDFGSTQSIKHPVINGVNNELAKAESKYLMVTHFHNDHYSGIQFLNNNIIFDEVYLPDFFSRDIVRLQFTLLSLLNESHSAYQIAYNMLSAIPDLLGHLNCNTQIIFVKRGDFIFNNLDSFRILWPKVDDFERQARKLYRDVIKYYNIDSYNIDIDYLNDIEWRTERFLSALSEIRKNEGNSRVLKLDGFQLKAERISQIKADIEYISNGKDKPSKMLKGSLDKEISSYQNKMCICFDNVYESNMPEDKRVLFLSDIYPTKLKAIIKSSDSSLALSEYYEVIKVPHHGTKDYFVSNLPASTHMIVPNGYAQTSSWRITRLYGSQYKERVFICANYYACEYSSLYKHCAACHRNHCICGFYPHYQLNL